jgi:hypothetical protein
MTDPPPRVAMCFFQLQRIGQGLQMSLGGFLLSRTVDAFVHSQLCQMIKL